LPCAATGADKEVWTCELTRSEKERSLVVWSVTGPRQFEAPSRYNQLVDGAGKQRSIIGSAIMIGPAPILLKAD
jgi:hypothetical protein